MSKFILFFADIGVIIAAYILSLLLRFQGIHGVVWNQWSTLIFILIVFPLLFYFYGLYNRLLYVQRLRLFFTVVKVILVALLVYVIAGFATKFSFLIQSRAYIIFLHITLVFLFFIVRIILVPRLLESYFTDVNRRKLCKFIGPLNRFKKLHIFLDENPVTGLNIFLDEANNNHKADNNEIFVCSQAENFAELYHEITLHNNSNTPLHIASNLFAELKLNWEWGYFNSIPVYTFNHKADQKLGDSIRRILDLTVSLVALVVLMPLLLVIAFAIKLDSRGPVIYKQKRCGKNGKEFTFYKFRSMYERERKDEKREEEFKSYIEQKLPKGKVINRQDITRVGWVLRKTSFDELPQFINVLKGDMSLIGPRPPIPYEVKHYKKWHKDRLLIKPGISGLWQIYGRGNMPCDSSIFLDLIYLLNRSISLDLKLMIKTVPAVLFGKGAY